jgi:hypothetical protein
MITWQDELSFGSGERDERNDEECRQDALEVLGNAIEETQQEMDIRCSGSFSQGWNRLASMINVYAELAKRRPE